MTYGNTAQEQEANGEEELPRRGGSYGRSHLELSCVIYLSY